MTTNKEGEAGEEGWVSLLNSPKWHYIRDGMSLCRKWVYFGKEFSDCDAPNTPTDCKTCRKKRNVELIGSNE